MPTSAKRKGSPELSKNLDVFLNVPYDGPFTNLLLAYGAGLVALGLTPRTSLEIPRGAARRDKITDLIGGCSHSVHDLSRVELDLNDPPNPSLNMSCELGIVVGLHRKRQANHTWFVFEASERRLKKSLSDLADTDPYIHQGTPGWCPQRAHECFHPVAAATERATDGARLRVAGGVIG